MATGKISTVKRQVSDATVNGVQHSLLQKGLNFYPGVKRRIFPNKEPDGRYRTGLDEDAAYIKRMSSKQERDIEIAKVRELKSKIEEMYGGIDLGPRSDFYSKMCDYKMDTVERAPIAVLTDGDNVFNLDIKEQAVVYAYLRVNSEVAPSAESLLTGNYSRCSFYINDSDVESERGFKQRSKVNKAIGLLESLSNEKKKKVSRVLGLPVTDNTKESVVYNALDKYIKDSENPRNSNHVDMFMKYVEMKDENLMIIDTIKQCITYNILRNSNGNIMRNDAIIAPTEQEAVKYYSNPKKQSEFMSLQDELESKKSMN